MVLSRRVSAVVRSLCVKAVRCIKTKDDDVIALYLHPEYYSLRGRVVSAQPGWLFFAVP